MDYKNSLNMPKTNFAMKANLNIKEPQMQQHWLDINLYQKILEKNKNKTNFLLHDGPPYANGNIHIGHALNKTLKDIIVRYKNLTGYFAPYIPGWDTHGLPIEVAMLKKHGTKTQQTTVERRQQCYEYACQQIEIQKKQFSRLGLLTDFSKIYRTLDHEFEIKQLELFLTIIKKDLIFRDKKPVYWSWSSQSALAEAEIEYKDVEDTSIYVKFLINQNNLLPNNSYLIIWTTTPWTLPANLCVSINPKLEYVLINHKNENFVVAKSLVEKLITTFNWNALDVKIVKIISANDLSELTYQHPFINQNGKVLLGDHVSNEDGTGIVHTAPGFGIDDYLVCKKYNIHPYTPIDNFGKYDATINDKELEGMFYADANEIIINRLIDKNALIKQEKIMHRVACDWRTKKPVIYRATDQWFINLAKINDQVIQTLTNDVKSPFQKNTDRMIEMIKNRVEWCISRQRVWGVPIPIIYNENNEPIMDVKLIENIINILDKNGVNVWFEWDATKFLTKKYLNNMQNYYKEKDIMDVWFDSGTSHQLFEYWGMNYPADLYLEGSDQYRGWFNSSLITGTIQHNKAPYKAILQHGFTLDEKGLKMSKSIGNTIDPLKIFDQYGADVFRLWVSSTEYSEDQRFGDNVIKQIAEIYRRIRNTLFKYSLSIINDFKPNEIQIEFTQEDKYILDQLNSIATKINYAYSHYKFSEVVKLINNFTIELSSWYFDLIKDEIYCGPKNSLRSKQIKTVIYKILLTMLIALAPIMPHTTDETYQELPFKKCESIHLEEWYELNPFNYLDKDHTTNFINFFDLKNKVYLKLEEARQQNVIKKSNMANIEINNNPTTFSLHTLKKYLNVASLTLNSDNLDINVASTTNQRCERCWNHFNKAHMHTEELCQRCNKVINNQN